MSFEIVCLFIMPSRVIATYDTDAGRSRHVKFWAMWSVGAVVVVGKLLPLMLLLNLVNTLSNVSTPIAKEACGFICLCYPLQDTLS